jgi:hypothetical protein
MSKEDWIILRLLMVAAKSNPCNPDVARAILYLTKRHGWAVLDCIAQLHKEKT